jgi:integrase
MQLALTYNSPKQIKYIEPCISKGYKGKYDIYYINLTTGKRTKKTTRTKIQREAFRELELFKKAYYNNLDTVKINNLFDLQHIIKKFKNSDLSPKTQQIYDTAFQKLITVIGNKELRFVIFKDIENFKSTVARVLKPNTVNIYLRTLKAAFNYAKLLGAIYENPVNAVKFIKIYDKNRLCFETRDIPRLINSVKSPFLKRIVKFAILSGMRRGEIMNLQWNDIDFERNEINIINKEDFKTKTRRNRIIPLSEEMKQLINENPYLQDENATIQASLFDFPQNVFELDHRKNINYIFGKIDGTAYNAGHISRLFKIDLRKAGFDEKYHFHCLRHTTFTNMGNNDFSVFQIKEIAGHADLKTTLVYVHASLDEMRLKMNSINYSRIDE